MTGRTPWQEKGIRPRVESATPGRTHTAPTTAPPSAAGTATRLAARTDQPTGVLAADPLTQADVPAQLRDLPSPTAEDIERRASRAEFAELLRGIVQREGVQVLVAIGAITVTIVLFFPWLDMYARDGRITVTGFGKQHVYTTLINLWSQQGPGGPVAMGHWAIMMCASASIVVTVVVINFFARRTALRFLVAGSSAAHTLFVILDLIYLNSVGEDLRRRVDLGGTTDPGLHIGLLIRAFAGNKPYPLPGSAQYQYTTTSFTGWALFAGIVALTSAILAAGNALYQYKIVPHDEVSSPDNAASSSFEDPDTGISPATAATSPDETATATEPDALAADRDWGAAG